MSLHNAHGAAHRLLLVLACCASLYAAKFNNGFVIDDIAMIVEGDVIQDLASIPGFWGSHAMAANNVDSGSIASFRPIALSTLALDYALWGTSPFGYHLTNLLLHLCGAALVWVVAGILLGRDRHAARLGAAAAFAVHPAIVEAHVWINGRSDVLALIFGLAGLTALDHALRATSRLWITWMVAAAGALLLACLSKETALLFGPVYAAHTLWHVLALRSRSEPTNAAIRRGVAALACSALAAIGFLAWRSKVLDGFAAGSSEDALRGLMQLGLLMLDGLAQIALPTRPEMRVLAGEYGPLPGYVFAASWLGAGLLLLWAGWSGLRRPAMWHAATAWFFALAPIGVISAVQWPGFGRYLYMPAAFVLIAAAGGIDQWWTTRPDPLVPRHRRVVMGVALVWFAWLAIVLQWQVHIYRDVDSFLTAIHVRNPAAKLVYAPLGGIRAEQGRLEEAIALLQHAIELNPAEVQPRVNLATALLTAGALPEAYRVAGEGVERFPERGEFYNVAAAAIADHDAEAAVRALLRCQELASTYTRCTSNLTMLTTTHPRAEVFRAALEAIGPR